MSEQQHTAEPWFVKYQNAIFGSDNYYICSAEYGSNDHAEIDHEINRGQSVADANARRIVACVNACAGLSTQCLEETGGGVEHYIAVIKQRDELLAALESILPEFRQHSLRNLRDDETSENHRCRVFDHDDHLYEIANKVIASVKANT